MFVFQLFVREVWTEWELNSSLSSEPILLGLVELCCLPLSFRSLPRYEYISLHLFFFTYVVFHSLTHMYALYPYSPVLHTAVQKLIGILSKHISAYLIMM